MDHHFNMPYSNMRTPVDEGTMKLTAYSHGAGCGCKIAPAVLDAILNGKEIPVADRNILVGYGTRDDAAVYDMGNGQALISTTDFFSPIVDDAFDLGRIAAVNALSDVYAMGGKPLLAIAILGWPVEKLPAELAARVIDGGRRACADAGITLAGGHSIDAPEPFFGLAVTGTVPVKNIKRNSTAREGDLLLLTKPIGLGIMATARKRGKLPPEHEEIATKIMCASNRVGTALGAMEGVHAMTDVTGFGLLGHLIEMCEGSSLSAEIDGSAVPVIPETISHLEAGCYPDGTFRNWKSHAAKVKGADAMRTMMLMSDPQTSGGLLIAIDPQEAPSIIALLEKEALCCATIGKCVPRRNGTVVEIISSM